MSLTDLANKYKTDKGTSGSGYHGFSLIYEQYLNDIKNDVKKVLEVGIGPGDENCGEAASLKMWADYFPNAIIHGADYQNFSHIKLPRIQTHLCDQNNRDNLICLMNKLGNNFDLIIDDGSHNVIHQQITFGTLFPYLKPGGVYILEDLHTSVWGGWGLPAMDEDCAYNVLLRIQNNMKIKSKYLLLNEVEYLKNNISYCKLYDTDKDHITSILKHRV